MDANELIIPLTRLRQQSQYQLARSGLYCGRKAPETIPMMDSAGIEISEGETVVTGQTLAVLEAMKMETH